MSEFVCCALAPFLNSTSIPGLPSWLSDAVLYFGACLGHTFFWVTALNILYAWPLPHGLLRYTRKLDVLIIIAGPVLFFFALGFHGGEGLSWEPGTAGFMWVPYVVFCWAVGFVLAPLAMVRYALRRTPAQVMTNHCELVDVAGELGYAPVGRSRKRYLARFPFNQVFHVDIVQKTLRLPRLPEAWDGLKILHLTDLHFHGTPDREFYHLVLDRCQKDFMPDLVAITGDVVDTHWHYRWIVPVLGRLRWNICAFAILGNHDQWYEPELTRRRLRKLRIDVLGNSWKQIEVRGRPMIVIGNEFPWFKPQADLADCPADVFRLCLSHSPDRISWARKNNIDLVLAGHVHGGQIRLPGIGSLFVPSRYSRRYDFGTFFEPPTVMHVSRGLSGQHPIRWNCRPEVTQIVLRHG